MSRQSRRAESGKTEGKIYAVCRTTGTALIAAVIVLCSLLVVPGIFGFRMYHVISGSMEPELKVGSLIYVREEVPGEIEAKEIIAYYSAQEDGGIITHRVLENNPVSGCFRTKGDANDAEDPMLVEYNRYIGSVKFKIPYMGKAFMIMTSLYGKIAAVCVVILGVVLNLAGSGQREESGENEN